MNKQSLEKIKFPKETVESKIVVKGSKFIGTIFYVKDEQEAIETLTAIRKKYYDATHNCYAYIIHPNIEKFSDDGEPSGSAGKPILSVLKGSGLTNTLAVVTRYFGGTKLGVGGLVRAYSDSVKESLKMVEVIEFEPIYIVELKLNFNETQHMYHLVDKLDKIKIENEEYVPEGVIFKLKIGVGKFNTIKEILTEKCNRNQEVKILEEKFDKI